MKKKFYRALTFGVSLMLAANMSLNAQKVTFNGEQLSLKQAFKRIEAVSKYKIAYNSSQLDVEKLVVLDQKDKDVLQIVEELLAGTGCTYQVNENYIVIIPQQQTKTVKKVKGVVKDTAGEPVIGATVMEKGSNNGTVSDFDGNFVLDVPEGALLEVSYIGFQPQQLNAVSGEMLSVTLKEDSELLEEVVVVGYGTQKKINLTGAVETVRGDKVEDRPIKSVTDALQGTVPGLTVSSATGQPGKFASFNIRGASSINSDGALVIIDGMPGDINLVNPNDIESISVLKDAASAAIYGARAASGVILITTKQGSSDRTKIEYSGNVSFNTPTRLPQSTTALQHAELSNLSFSNAGLAVQFSQEAINAIKTGSTTCIPNGNDWIYTANMDWIDLMFDNSFMQTHNLSISKATKNLSYLVSASWLDNNGLFSEYGPDNYDRWTIRSNVNVKLNEKLELDTRLTFSAADKKYHPSFGSDKSGESGGWTIPYITFIQAGPNMPIYDTNGNYARYRMQANPIQALKEGGEGSLLNKRTEGIATLSYKPFEGLTLKAVGGASFRNGSTKVWRRSYGKYGPNGLISMAAGQTGDNSIYIVKENEEYYTGQLLAEYHKTFGNNHDLNILGGWSTEYNHVDNINAYRSNIIGNEVPSLNLGSTEGWTNGADEYDWALVSGFMRLNYAYKSKYLFEANFRADASSRFSKKHRWGIFPSFSAGWRVTEEEFMKNQKVFSNLKLRASWGQLGNQSGLGYYDHIPQYQVSGYYPFGGTPSQWAYVQNLPSEERSWETVDMKNIAIEMGFLDNRLNVTAEYFWKTNKDMLVSIEVPSTIGIEVPTGNYGKLNVKGWELSASWRDKIKDFNYYVSFSLSDRVDKLTDYGVTFNGFTAGVNQKIQGYSLGAIFGYKTDGYFTSKEEVAQSAVINKAVTDVGDIKYIDKDGDGKISAPNDLEYLGSTMPRYEFSFTLGGDWKGLDFNALFQGVGKRNFYLSRFVTSPFYETFGNYSYSFHLDYWTPENPNALLPRPLAGGTHNYEISDHWLQNAAYLRLKNLQIGYTLPETITKRIGMEKLRIYFSGENVFELSKLLNAFDPELSDINGYMYPIMRNYSFGLNITF